VGPVKRANVEYVIMGNLQTTLKELTPEMFAHLGENQVVYIKPVEVNGISGFAVHAANGQKLAIFDSYEAAVSISMENNLHPAHVH
jgi:hypothetical protein